MSKRIEVTFYGDRAPIIITNKPTFEHANRIAGRAGVRYASMQYLWGDRWMPGLGIASKRAWDEPSPYMA
jgi:hypothetical protein